MSSIQNQDLRWSCDSIWRPHRRSREHPVHVAVVLPRRTLLHPPHFWISITDQYSYNKESFLDHKLRFIGQELEASELNIPKTASRFLLSIYIYYRRNCNMNSICADIEFHKEDRQKQRRPCFQRCVFSPERWKNAAFIHSPPPGWRRKKIVFHKLWLFEDAGKPFCPFRDILQRKKYIPACFFSFFSRARIPAWILF